MNQHATLRELAPEIPAELEAVVDRAMHTDVAARYVDVREFARELLPFARPETRSSWEAEFASDSDVTTELPDFSAMFPEKTTPDKSAPVPAAATATTPEATPATVALTESPLPPAGATLAASEPAYSIGTLTLSARESLLPKPDPKPAPPRKRPPVLLAGAVTALTLVGVGAWVSTRPSAAPAPRAPVARPAASTPPPAPRIPPPEVLRTESQPAAPAPVELTTDAGSPPPATNEPATNAPAVTTTNTTPAEPPRRSRRSRHADAGASPTEARPPTTPAEETGANGVGIR
jgi:hypothetical protein